MATKAHLPAAREEDIQAAIKQGLELMGYRVLQTSRRGITCKSCGKKVYGGDGVSEGVPDLLVLHRSWPKYVGQLMEVKGPKTPVSPAQQELADAARVVIARSWEEALAAVREFERELREG